MNLTLINMFLILLYTASKRISWLLLNTQWKNLPALCAGKVTDEKLKIGALVFVLIVANYCWLFVYSVTASLVHHCGS